MGTRAVAYIRVSTQKQADTGVSLDAQKAKIAAYAGLYDLDVVEYIIDAGESAGSLDRPGLTRALSMLGPHADALIVIKLDRLTRSVRDLGDLMERYFAKYSLLSVSEQIDTRSAGGRMVLNLLAVISQWEREMAAERTTAAKQYQKANGEFCGGHPPYGYRLVDGSLVDHPEEQQALAMMRTQREAGASYGVIASAFKTRAGTQMSRAQVRRLV